nr:ABATE domain-containing protein [Amycolatopsis sp. Hca4]
MGDKHGFRFHGGRPSVNFTATVGERWRDGGFERLPDPAALGRWFTEAGLTSADPRCTEADLTAARELREAVYRLMVGQVSEEDLATVNRWAGQPPPVTALVRTAEGLRTRVVSATVPSLLGSIAADAVAILGARTPAGCGSARIPSARCCFSTLRARGAAVVLDEFVREPREDAAVPSRRPLTASGRRSQDRVNSSNSRYCRKRSGY